MSSLKSLRRLSVKQRFAATAVFFSALVVFATALVLQRVSNTSPTDSDAQTSGLPVVQTIVPNQHVPITVRALPIIFWGGHSTAPGSPVNTYSLTKEFLRDELVPFYMNSIIEGSRYKPQYLSQFGIQSTPNVYYILPEGLSPIVIDESSPKNGSSPDWGNIMVNRTYNINGQQKTLLQIVNDNSPIVDEIWFIAAGNAGYAEATMTGPNAYWTNGPSIVNYGFNKTLFVMGFNYEAIDPLGHIGLSTPELAKRGLAAQMLHSYNHRIEGVLRHFEQTRQFIDIDVFGRNVSGGLFSRCGGVHFPPNATASQEYQYSLLTSFTDYCSDWYPGLANQGIPNQTCALWGCTQYGYQKWWMGNILGANNRVILAPPYFSSPINAPNSWEYVTNKTFNGSNIIADAASDSNTASDNSLNTAYVLGTRNADPAPAINIGNPTSAGMCSTTSSCPYKTFASVDSTCRGTNVRCNQGQWVSNLNKYVRVLKPTEICPSGEAHCICSNNSVSRGSVVVSNQGCGGYASLANLCTSISYSGWGSCVNGVERRVVNSKLPDGCVPGTLLPLERPCGTTTTGFKCESNRCVPATGDATFSDSATCGVICEGQATSACNGAQSRVSRPGQELVSSLNLTCGEQFQVRSVRTNGTLATGLRIAVLGPGTTGQWVGNESILNTSYAGLYRVQTWGTDGQCHEASVTCSLQSTPSPTPAAQPAAPTAVFSCYDLGPEIRDNRLTISWPANSQESGGYSVHVSTNSNFAGYTNYPIAAGATRSLTLTPNNFSALNTSDLRRYYVRLYYLASGQHSKVLTTRVGDCQLPNAQFPVTDVARALPSPHPYLSGIHKTVSAGVMQGKGNGTFAPNENLTRDQVAVVLNNAFNLGALASPRPTTRTFWDVPTTYWAHPYVEKMYSRGFTVGCGTTVVGGVTWKQFCPTGLLTRQEIATFLTRGLNITPDSTSTAAYFSDVPSSWPTFYGFINAMGRREIMEPKATCARSANTGTKKFCPYDYVNRGEMARIVENLLYYRQDNP